METSGLNGVVLESDVEVNGGTCSLTLTTDEVKWSPVKYDIENHNEVSIPISEVIGAVQDEGDPRNFSIHHIEQKPKYVWNVKEVIIKCEDEKTRNIWVKWFLSKLDNPALNRPKSLLVFINPTSGGGGKTMKIYHEKVSPVFQLAGIKTHVIVTERGMQASEMLQTYDLSSIDGVICVGGDGTMSEVAQGLLNRTIKDYNMDVTKDGVTFPKTEVRLGVIPSGSFDMLCEEYTIGTRDPVTAALHVVVGDEIATDVCSVQQNGKLSFLSPLMMNYGTTSDMLKYTEGHIMRLFGPWRYLYGIIRSTALHRRFHAEIEYLPAPRDKENTVLPEERNAVRGNETMTTDPKTGYRKITGDFHDLSFFPLYKVGKILPDPDDARPWYIRAKEFINNGSLMVGRLRLCSRMEYLSVFTRFLTKQELEEEVEFMEACFGNDFRIRVTPINGKEHLFSSTADGDLKLFEETGNTLDFRIFLHQACLRMFARGIEKPIGE